MVGMHCKVGDLESALHSLIIADNGNFSHTMLIFYNPC
jgi:hypothetical protein